MAFLLNPFVPTDPRYKTRSLRSVVAVKRGVIKKHILQGRGSAQHIEFEQGALVVLDFKRAARGKVLELGKFFFKFAVEIRVRPRIIPLEHHDVGVERKADAPKRGRDEVNKII